MGGDQGLLSGRRGVLRRSTVALIVAGVLFLNLAMVSLWAWRTFASSQGFADTTTDMLKEPAVRAELSEQIVNALELPGPTSQLAVTARPLIEQIASQLVGTDAFQGMFHAGVRELHSSLVEGSRSSLVVNVDDAAQLVRDRLAVLNPDMADAIPPGALDVAVGVSQSTPVDTTIRVASLAGWLAPVFAALSAVCLVWAVRRARDRRRALEIIGLLMAAVGVAHFAILSVGLQLTASLGETPRARTALRAVFWSAGHLLNVQAKVAITAGLVIALAAAHSGTGQIRARLVTVIDRLAAAGARPGWRALGCLALIASGYFALRWPEASTAIIVRTLALAAFLAGAVGLLDVIGSVSWTEPAPERFHSRVRRTATGATLALTAVCAVLLFGGLSFVRAVRAPDPAQAAMSEVGCNDHVELCDRRLDEVTFAATHNSMSASANDGFYLNRQTGSIAAQLSSGVRAFLLDLHYGVRSPYGSVRTDMLAEAAARAPADDVTPAQREARDRVFKMFGVGSDDDRRDVYLCHGNCELGAVHAADTFRLIHDYLRENPNEVVILVLQDEVAAADAIEALEDGGLADRAYPWRSGEALPTLREMISENRNVLVLAEHHGGAEPWYVPAYDLLQETQYEFPTVADFSCEPNRGRAANPMLLVNHWLEVNPPDPAVAADANARPVLLGRARECGEQRERHPNIVAVDFYATGDLFDVVRELNGVT